MNRFFLFLIAVGAMVLAGCAGSPKADASADSTSDVDGNGNKVSSIPWNRPQSWEGGGMLGGAMGR